MINKRIQNLTTLVWENYYENIKTDSIVFHRNYDQCCILVSLQEIQIETFIDNSDDYDDDISYFDFLWISFRYGKDYDNMLLLTSERDKLPKEPTIKQIEIVLKYFNL